MITGIVVHLNTRHFWFPRAIFHYPGQGSTHVTSNGFSYAQIIIITTLVCPITKHTPTIETSIKNTFI